MVWYPVVPRLGVLSPLVCGAIIIKSGTIALDFKELSSIYVSPAHA